MNCTGEENRKRICREYDVKAIGCIALYGGREVVSDAGGKVITERYYKFLCIHKGDGHHEFIQCGYPTARHICKLSGIGLPMEFNPFKINGSGKYGPGSGGGGGSKPQNKGRKQLDTAIRLFITVKDVILKPETPIFKVQERVEADMYSDVELRDVKAVNTILGNFHTTLPQIVAELKMHGTVRKYNFDILIDMINKSGIIPNNYI